MFVLELWDSPMMLLGELALSVAVIAGILFVARIANARSGAPTRPGSRDSVMPPGEAGTQSTRSAGGSQEGAGGSDDAQRTSRTH